MRVFLLGMVLVLSIVGCKKRFTDELNNDDAPSRVLHGAELTQEMLESPSREASVAFSRIGLMWDAPAREALEVSVSVDGKKFTDFKPATILSEEIEGTMIFTGEFKVTGEKARFYRLRSSRGRLPTYLYTEFLQEKIDETPTQPGREEETPANAPLRLTQGAVNIQSRAAWGAISTSCSGSHKADRISIHHTETPLPDSVSFEARLRQIQNFHIKTRGWCDIAYHYLVSADGRIWEGRVAHLIGAHVERKNTGNIGISLMGVHTKKPITSDQINSVAALSAQISGDAGFVVDEETLKGHRDQKATTCPGDALYQQLGQIREEARKKVKQPAEPPVLSALVGVIYRNGNTNDRIRGATVRLQDGQTTTSNENGVYRFADIKPGKYVVSAEAPGFPSKSITRELVQGEIWGSIGL